MNRRALGAAVTGAALLALAASAVASAHVVKQFGSYSIALGWRSEPTYVDEQNAVVAIVTAANGRAVNDLNPGDLTVTVSAGGQTSAALPLEPSYDPDTGFGTPGEYFTDLIPTSPGVYTFHLAGTVHGTAVDETATSSDTTFNSVEDPSSIQFPAKVPTTTEISAKVDQLGTRVQSAAAAGSASAAAVQSAHAAADAATAAVSEASSRAWQALLVGVLMGGLGVALGMTGVVLALRARTAA